MTKTLQKKLNNLTLGQLFDIAQELDNSFWAYEDLKEFVIDMIKEDNILLATHILNTLNDDPTDFYKYDVGMGTLENVAPITTKETMLDYLQNYNDEDIKKVLKNIKED